MKINNHERFNRLPDAFLFDTDNTLYPYDPAHAAAQQAVLNVDLVDLQHALMQAWRLPSMLVRITDDHANKMTTQLRNVMLAIRVVEQREAHDDDEGRNWISYSIQGFKILFETPAVLTIMSAFLVLAMIYMPTEMVVLPAYYNAIDEPESMGFILTVMAASTTLGSLLFERVAKHFVNPFNRNDFDAFFDIVRNFGQILLVL